MDASDYNIGRLFNQPMGKGAFASVKIVRAEFRRRYEEVKKKKGKEFEYNVFTKGDDYFIHFKQPSEHVDDVAYDVVFQFIPRSREDRIASTVNNYVIKVFSNCPSFTFAFAYAFNINDKIIDKFKPRYNRIVLKNEPVVRNPNLTVGFEKSLYFAYFTFTDNLLNMKNKLDDEAKKATKRNLFNVVVDADSKLAERQNKEKKQNREKKKKKKRAKKKSNSSKPKTGSTSSHRISKKKKIGGRKKITGIKKL